MHTSKKGMEENGNANENSATGAFNILIAGMSNIFSPALPPGGMLYKKLVLIQLILAAFVLGRLLTSHSVSHSLPCLSFWNGLIAVFLAIGVFNFIAHYILVTPKFIFKSLAS